METLDYVIVGSGIAGMHAAYRLSREGKKVAVLERESWIGGRMMTVTVAGHAIDYGAKVVAGYNKHMLSLAHELGVPLVPSRPAAFGLYRDGRIHPLDSSRKSSFLLTGAISFRAKARLCLGILFLLVRYRHLDFHDLGKALYLDDMSAYDDLRRIVGAEAFDYVVETFSQDIVFYGTKEFSRAFLYSFIPKLPRLRTYSFPEGIGQLNRAMAESVRVETGTRVTSVRRTPAGVTVLATRDGKEVSYRAKQAILAVPGNRALEIMADPSPEEAPFFSRVRYASTVQMIGTTRTDLFSETGTIWTVPKENLSFSCVDRKPWPPPAPGMTFFHASLRGDAYRRLRAAGTFDPAHLEALLQEEFPRLRDVRIVDMQAWESATPVMYPGYLTSVARFLGRPDRDARILFCGDYLENPSTEGALTSSVKLLRRMAGAS